MKFHNNNINPIKKPILAIIGGTGHDATIDLQIELSNSMKEKLLIEKDQDYYRVIIDNNSTIPNRESAILYNGINPLPFYLKSVNALEELGGDVLLIPCNTAHVYIESIRNNTDMKVIDMIDTTTSHITNNFKRIKKVGILATSSTLKKELYHNSFNNVEIISPGRTVQLAVTRAIYGIKAGFIGTSTNLTNDEKIKLSKIYNNIEQIQDTNEVQHPRTLLKRVVEHLMSKHVDKIILGCTDLPLVFTKAEIKENLINPTQIMAEVAVDSLLKIERDNKVISENLNNIMKNNVRNIRN